MGSTSWSPGPAPVPVADPTVAFARALRGAGLTVPPDTVITYAKALDAVGLGSRDRVYWAGRSTLVRRPEDVPVYDVVFATFWDRTAAETRPSEEPQRRSVALDKEDDDGRRACDPNGRCYRGEDILFLVPLPARQKQ